MNEIWRGCPTDRGTLGAMNVKVSHGKVEIPLHGKLV